MGEVASEGRTVIFVSHNMGAIKKLCNSGILLKEGASSRKDLIDNVIESYYRDFERKESIIHNGITINVEFFDSNRKKTTIWEYNEYIYIDVYVASEYPLYEPTVDVVFYSERDEKVFAILGEYWNKKVKGVTENSFKVRFKVLNIGFACNFLGIDIGIKANHQLQYLARYESVGKLIISKSKIHQKVAQNAVLWLPCEVLIEDLKYEKFSIKSSVSERFV